MKKNDMSEVQQTENGQIAAKIFVRKQLIELLKVFLPWIVFSCDFGVGLYTVVNASVINIIATGVFYVLSLAFLFLMKRGE